MKNFTTVNLLVFSTLFLFLSSCETYVYRYRATTVNTPMFTRKGDFEVDLSGSPEIGGLNGSVAITNHFGVGAGFAFSNSSDSIASQDALGQDLGSFLYEDNQVDYNIAAIYFNKFNNSLQYEVQLGYAYDERTEKINSNIDRTNSIYNFSERKTPMYTRLYLQPAIGRNGKYFDWNFATRFQLISYKDLLIHYPSRGISNYSDLIVEPVFTIRAGYRFVKLMLQAGARFSIPKGPYFYVPIHLGGGLAFPINEFTKKANKEKNKGESSKGH